MLKKLVLATYKNLKRIQQAKKWVTKTHNPSSIIHN